MTNSTPVPNWIDPRFPKKRKQSDWISQSQFQRKTGLSRKAVSTAIASLIRRQLVRVYDASGIEVDGSGKGRKFYAFACPNEQNVLKNRVKNIPQNGNFLLPTKEGRWFSTVNGTKGNYQNLR